MADHQLDFSTLAAHAGTGVRVDDVAVTAPPITPSTTFTGDSIADVHDALAPDGSGFAYARNANPTVRALELALAPLEQAEDVVAFGSGMAAIHAALRVMPLERGDTIVAANALYGVTRTLLSDFQQRGIGVEYVDISRLDRVHAALAAPRCRALYFESIANPLLQVSDVGALAAMARDEGAVSIIDNTFATPYLLRPLTLGVDIVVHSATKYIAGHGDVMAGVVAASAFWCDRLRTRRTVTGGILSPFEAWLTMRGLRTLPIRMERQCTSASALAGWLQGQSWVEHVYYPGLPSSPYHHLASDVLRGRYGAMVSFDLRADREQTLEFLDRLTLIIPGTSLGDVVTLALYPALSSHRGLDDEQRRTAGIGDCLVRLSVGLESVDDLRADLARAAALARIAYQEERASFSAP